MVGDAGAVTGIIQLVLLALAPTAVLWVLLHCSRFGEWATSFGRRTGVIRQAERPLGPPLEQIAADIRRIAASIESLPPGTPGARRQAVLLAYDEALAAACQALGVDDTMTSMPPGLARDAERLRIECELEYAGLMFNDPPAA